jgi:hypothetical protein
MRLLLDCCNCLLLSFFLIFDLCPLLPQKGLLAAGAAVVAGIGAIAAIAGSGPKVDTKEKAAPVEPEPKIDVSVPYNAAAKLAYQEWKGSDVFNEAEFTQFEEVYLGKAVAEAAAKKTARDIEAARAAAEKELETAKKAAEKKLEELRSSAFFMKEGEEEE